jgi:hypothetical protein
MLRTGSSVPFHFSPWQHSRVCFGLAVILFVLAAGSVYWNESAHFQIYVAMGVIFAVLGLIPVVVHALQNKTK